MEEGMPATAAPAETSGFVVGLCSGTARPLRAELGNLSSLLRHYAISLLSFGITKFAFFYIWCIIP